MGTSFEQALTTAVFAAVEQARVRKGVRGYDVTLGQPNRAVAYRVAAHILGWFAVDPGRGYASVEVRDERTVRVRVVERILRPYHVRYEYPNGVKGSQAHTTLDGARSFAAELAGRGAAVEIEDTQTGQRLAV